MLRVGIKKSAARLVSQRGFDVDGSNVVFPGVM